MSESKGIVIEEQELREMARTARGTIQHIYLHWSGGHYGVNEDAYHLCGPGWAGVCELQEAD